MKVRVLIAVALLAAVLPAVAQSTRKKPKTPKPPKPAAAAPVWAGTWVLPVDGRNLLVLTMRPQGKAVGGRLTRPAHVQMSNGVFSDIQGVRNDSLVDLAQKKNQLLITTQNANDPSDKDNFALTVNGDTMDMSIADIPPGSLEPWHLHRATDDATMGQGWEPNRAYVQGPEEKPCDELRQLFAADQEARHTDTVDWNVVNRQDAERRARVHQLLAQGLVQTAQDFHQAAFIFQHGDSPEDYLLAHTLALIAVSKGDAGSVWIASATLDRYLQSIDKPQIYGTQFGNPTQGNAATQDPYDRTLVSDALRLQIGVPSQAEQQQRLQAYSQK